MPEFFWVRWLQESSLRAYLDCILLPRRRSGAAVIGLESVPSGHQGYRLSLFFRLDKGSFNKDLWKNQEISYSVLQVVQLSAAEVVSVL